MREPCRRRGRPQRRPLRRVCGSGGPGESFSAGLSARKPWTRRRPGHSADPPVRACGGGGAAGVGGGGFSAQRRGQPRGVPPAHELSLVSTRARPRGRSGRPQDAAGTVGGCSAPHPLAWRPRVLGVRRGSGAQLRARPGVAGGSGGPSTRTVGPAQTPVGRRSQTRKRVLP